MPPPGGCVSGLTTTGCTVGRGLPAPRALATSPDGRHVYALSAGAVAVLVRDPRTGTLTQLDNAPGCVATAGTTGCATGRALEGAADVA